MPRITADERARFHAMLDKCRILDTHGGSGSSVIACIDLGYEITWIEKDPDYYEQAVKRVKNYCAQERLFEPEEIRPTQVELL